MVKVYQNESSKTIKKVASIYITHTLKTNALKISDNMFNYFIFHFLNT